MNSFLSKTFIYILHIYYIHTHTITQLEKLRGYYIVTYVFGLTKAQPCLDMLLNLPVWKAVDQSPSSERKGLCVLMMYVGQLRLVVLSSQRF